VLLDQVAHDALCRRVQGAGDHGQAMVGVELVRQRDAESRSEGFLEGSATSVPGEDRGDVSVAERGDPAGVVQDLGDDVARGLVPLELQDVHVPGLVKGEQVDEVPVGGRHLAPDDQQRRSENVRVGLDEVLELLLLRHQLRGDVVTP
jgi:hypothetical protein